MSFISPRILVIVFRVFPSLHCFYLLAILLCLLVLVFNYNETVEFLGNLKLGDTLNALGHRRFQVILRS